MYYNAFFFPIFPYKFSHLILGTTKSTNEFVSRELTGGFWICLVAFRK